MKLNGIDHVAILVANTEESLRCFRDQLGLPVLFSEVMTEQHVRLTHLDMGGCHLQLVEPLTPDHPLRKQGTGLHHLCFRVADVPAAMATMPDDGLISRDAQPRRGPGGRQSAFIRPETTQGVLIEVTGPAGGK